jgi:hypothetical protein
VLVSMTPLVALGIAVLLALVCLFLVWTEISIENSPKKGVSLQNLPDGCTFLALPQSGS